MPDAGTSLSPVFLFRSAPGVPNQLNQSFTDWKPEAEDGKEPVLVHPATEGWTLVAS